MRRLLSECSVSATYLGILAAFVGVSSTFAIVIEGLKAVGASDAQAASGLMFSCLSMGFLCLYWGLSRRKPVFAAWSLPGAAMFISMTAPKGGFSETVGALIICAVMIILSGLVRPFGRLVEQIPRSLANAMLGGILLGICLAPAKAVGEMPMLALPIFVAWLIGLFINRILAVPFALVAFILIVVFAIDLPDGSADAFAQSLIIDVTWVWPTFTLASAISIGIPLFVVTMASQNIPGVAVMKIYGIDEKSGPLFRDTGILSLITAPFGAVPANLSALVAGMCCGPESHPEMSRRYWAAISCGISYILMGLAAGLMTTLLSYAPELLIASVAGLALIGVLMRAIIGAFEVEAERDAAAVTFIVTASGMTLLGVSGTFWGLVAGLAIMGMSRFKSRFLDQSA